MSRTLLAVSGLLVAVPVWSADLEGTVRLKGSRVPVEEAVVWFTPDDPTEIEPAAEELEIVTVGKEFEPRVLVAPVGSRVRFPNRDTILHNVFSVAAGSAFDLGFYGQGPGEITTFRIPGVVRVFCNVHHAMVAYVVVLGTPYSARPGRDGSFELRGLPDGPGSLTVWHERADPVTVALAATESRVEVELEVSKPRVPKHKDKNGRSYTRRRRYGG